MVVMLLVVMSLVCGQVEARCSCHMGHEHAVLIPRQKNSLHKQESVQSEVATPEEREVDHELTEEDIPAEVVAEVAEDLPSRDVGGIVVDELSPYANLFDVTAKPHDRIDPEKSNTVGLGRLPDDASMSARWRYHLAQVHAMLPTISRKVAGLVGGVVILGSLFVARWQSSRDAGTGKVRSAHGAPSGTSPIPTDERIIAWGRGAESSPEALDGILVTLGRLGKEIQQLKRKFADSHRGNGDEGWVSASEDTKDTMADAAAAGLDAEFDAMERDMSGNQREADAAAAGGDARPDITADLDAALAALGKLTT